VQFAIVLTLVVVSSALVLLWQFWTGALVPGDPPARSRPPDALEHLDATRHAA
jgi:hypothetical protein